MPFPGVRQVGGHHAAALSPARPLACGRGGLGVAAAHTAMGFQTGRWERGREPEKWVGEEATPSWQRSR